MATHSSILAWRIPQGCKESDTTAHTYTRLGSRGVRFTTHQIPPVCGHCARSHDYTKMGRDSTSPSEERMMTGWDDRIRVCLCGDTMALGHWRRGRPRR